MNNEIDTNDEVLFDRLVDGELAADERRRLLASLDDRPGAWRQCALAFLEAQTWKQEFGRFAGGSAARAGGSRSAVTQPPASRRAVRWYALAASVLLAFTLGLALGGFSLPSHQAATPNPANQFASATPERGQAEANAAAPADALTFWVRDEAGQPRPLRVPLIDAAAVDQQLGLDFPSGVPAAVRDHLRQRGYEVESRRRYAPLWLEDGRPLVLPVEDTKIIPISNPL